MRHLIDHLLEFFSDGEHLSAYRLLMLAWGLGVLAVMLYLTLHTGAWVVPDLQVFAFLLSLIFGKMVQNGTELKIYEASAKATTTPPPSA